MKAIYMRVSKEEEGVQNPEDQLPVIMHTFKLKKEDCVTYIERRSAYDESKQDKRDAFIELKKKIEEGEYQELYVYKVDRIERNMVRLFEFFFFCESHNCRIFSAEEPTFNMQFDNSAQGNLMRYLNVLIFGSKAQGESENISVRTKKSFKKLKNSTYSNKGNKVGKKFTNSSGEKITISGRKEDLMYDYIVKLILSYEERNLSSYYPIIIDQVKNNFDIVLSPAYLSNIKQKVVENGCN